MLSFEKGRLIGRISGGKYDKELLYLYDPDSDKEREKGMTKKVPFDDDILNELLFKNLKQKGRLNTREIQSVISHLEKNVLPADEKILDLYDRAKAIKDKKIDKELILHDGNIVPVPDINRRATIYVTGPSGSGKSTWISNYTAEFKKLFPEKEIILFSRKGDDEVLDKLGPKRMILDESLADDPISPDELKHKLVIFDDTDTIPQKKIRDAVTHMKNDILEVGRSYDINIITSAHNVTDYKHSRTILQESDNVVIFPKGGVTRQLRYYLKGYLGLNDAEIKRILNLPSRWIQIYTSFPQAIVYSGGCYLLNKD